MQPDNNFYNYIAIHEGGISNNPNDKGGLTNKGITWTTFQQIANPVLGIAPTQANFKALTTAQFRKVVDYYWNKSKSNLFTNRNIANLFCDLYWGSGTWAASLLVRAMKTLGVTNFADKGDDTPITADLINTANKLPSNQLYAALTTARINFYKAIVNYDKTQSVFLAGWLNRAKDLYDNAKANWNTKTIGVTLFEALLVYATYKYVGKPLYKAYKDSRNNYSAQ